MRGGVGSAHARRVPIQAQEGLCAVALAKYSSQPPLAVPCDCAGWVVLVRRRTEDVASLRTADCMGWDSSA
jgi:hypothetical protein